MTRQSGMGLQAVRDPTREKEKRARENRECRRQAAFIKVSGSVPYKIQKIKNKKLLTLTRICANNWKERNGPLAGAFVLLRSPSPICS